MAALFWTPQTPANRSSIYDTAFMWWQSAESGKIVKSDLFSVKFLTLTVSKAPWTFPSPSFWRSEVVIREAPVHLQRRCLHVRGFGILDARRRAVPGGPPHGAESSRGAADVAKPRRSWHGVAPQEPARHHQVPVALRVREGVAWAPGAGAPDLPPSRRRWWRGFDLSHLEHHLEAWTGSEVGWVLWRDVVVNRSSPSEGGCDL